MLFLNYLEVKVKGQGYFMGLIRLKKASNVARGRLVTQPIQPFRSNMTGTSVMDCLLFIWLPVKNMQKWYIIIIIIIFWTCY